MTNSGNSRWIAAAILVLASTLVVAQDRFASAYVQAIEAYRNGDYETAEKKFLESINGPGATKKRGANVRLGSQQRGFYPELYLAFVYFHLGKWQDVLDYGRKAEKDIPHDDPRYDDLINNETEAKKALADPAYDPRGPVLAVGARHDVPAADSAPGPAYALVIGIDHYEQFDSLKTAVNDAVEVERVLRAEYGFETKLLKDPTRSQIMDELDDYSQRLPEASSLLIYYAGHGYYDPRSEKAFWIPHDAQRDRTSKWIAADDITRMLKTIASRHILVISDSCFSGAIVRGAPPAFTTADHDEYLRKNEVAKSRTFVSSGANEPVSDSGGPSNHSVFAGALLRGLTDAGRQGFTSLELFRDYIAVSVAGGSQQSPQWAPIRDSGHVAGDFVFRRKKPS